MDFYFKHIGSVIAIRERYKHLAKLHHPDMGGDTATMQEINSQYHSALKKLDSIGGYKYSEEEENDISRDLVSQFREAEALGCRTIGIEGVCLLINQILSKNKLSPKQERDLIDKA